MALPRAMLPGAEGAPPPACRTALAADTAGLNSLWPGKRISTSRPAPLPPRRKKGMPSAPGSIALGVITPRFQRTAESNSPPPMRDFSFHPGDATNLRDSTIFWGNSACGRLIRLFQGARPARSSYGWSEDWRPEWGNLMLRLGLLSA